MAAVVLIASPAEQKLELEAHFLVAKLVTGKKRKSLLGEQLQRFLCLLQNKAEGLLPC